MDGLLNSLTAKQALEWELFSKENPSFQDTVLLQIAHVARVFANAFINKETGEPWSLYDFMPWKKKEAKKSEQVPGLLGLLLHAGDEKVKNKFFKEETRPKVRGTDGKWYNYALEEFATNVKPPKRMRKPVSQMYRTKKPARLRGK